MIRIFASIVLFLYVLPCSIHAQDYTNTDKSLAKAKSELKSYIEGENPDYFKAGQTLEKIISTAPGNAEAWYFFGFAIDKYNVGDGDKFFKSSIHLAVKASDAYQNAIELSDDDTYSGDKIIFDPHTSILNIWGTQAFRYYYNGLKDSAVWCLRQAGQRGGINRTVLEYYRQQLEECTPGSLLFSNGDISTYYLEYLQEVEAYRKDVLCVDLNFLNTSWYFPLIVKNQGYNDSIAQALMPKEKRIKWEAKTFSVLYETMSAGHRDSLTVSWTVNPSDDNNYLYRADLILMDYLKYNAFRKDIYFSTDVPSGKRLSLNIHNYLQLRGLTYRVTADTASSNLTYLESRLNKLPPLPPDNNTYLNNPDNIQVLNNYRFAYTGTAVLAANYGKYEEAEKLLQTADNKYPENKLPFFAKETKDWYMTLKNNIALKKPVEW